MVIFQFLLRQAFADDEASTRLLQILLFLLLSTASLMFIPCAVMSSFTLSIHFFGCLPLLLVPSTYPYSATTGSLFPSILVTCPNNAWYIKLFALHNNIFLWRLLKPKSGFRQKTAINIHIFLELDTAASWAVSRAYTRKLLDSTSSTRPKWANRVKSLTTMPNMFSSLKHDGSTYQEFNECIVLGEHIWVLINALIHANTLTDKKDAYSEIEICAYTHTKTYIRTYIPYIRTYHTYIHWKHT